MSGGKEETLSMKLTPTLWKRSYFCLKVFIAMILGNVVLKFICDSLFHNLKIVSPEKLLL